MYLCENDGVFEAERGSCESNKDPGDNKGENTQRDSNTQECKDGGSIAATPVLLRFVCIKSFAGLISRFIGVLRCRLKGLAEKH